MQPSSAARYVAIAPHPGPAADAQAASFNHAVAQHSEMRGAMPATRQPHHYADLSRIYSSDEQDAAFNLLALNQQNTAPLAPHAFQTAYAVDTPRVNRPAPTASKPLFPSVHSRAQTKTWFDAEGNIVPQGTPHAMSYTAFAKETFVDSSTGTIVPKGTAGAIKKINYDRRNVMVNARTGKTVPQGTPDAIAQTTYLSRITRNTQPYVDSATGRTVPKDTPGAIQKLSLSNRIHRQKRRTHDRERLINQLNTKSLPPLLPRPAQNSGFPE